jgi:hypothetical protein
MEFGPLIIGLLQKEDVSVRTSIENRIPIYQDELDERSESKKKRECSLLLSHSLSLSLFLSGATTSKRYRR